VWILWVEETLKLAAAGAHPLCHLALADTRCLIASLPSQDNPLPRKRCHFLVRPLRPQKLIEPRAHMPISPICHLQPPCAASQRGSNRSRASDVSS
jgi:hypothetical protein